MDHYAVIGNPIQHSLSPQIHRLFAQQTQQELDYRPILVALGGLEQALNDFQAQAGKGLNVTLPFKQEVFAFVSARSQRAENAGAINTILFNEDGSRFGDNTDGVGLVQDLMVNHQFSMRDKAILLLGAGGAVRGVIDAILAKRPQRLIIANRTSSKAFMLADGFSQRGPVTACELSELAQYQFDLVINGTSASLHAEDLFLPDHIISDHAYCYDMVYGRGITPFLHWAKKQGAARLSDGLGMLVEQAAESFYLWRGVRPETRAVLLKMRSLIK